MKQIHLGGKNGAGKIVLVDDEDYEWLYKYNWQCNIIRKSVYAIVRMPCDPVTKKRKTIKMHRVIMNPPEGLVVDHIDGNGLNNQRSNMRICTAAQNSKNRTGYGASKYLGVGYKHRKDRSDMWVMHISLNGKNLLEKGFSINKWGYVQAEIMAAKAYDEAAKKYHGEFANLNFK